MLDDELSPVGQNLAELREGPGQEIRFRRVVTGPRMRAFDDPVDLVVYMLEKTCAIAVLKALENLSDGVFGDHEILLCIREQCSLSCGRPGRPVSSVPPPECSPAGARWRPRSLLSKPRSLARLSGDQTKPWQLLS